MAFLAIILLAAQVTASSLDIVLWKRELNGSDIKLWPTVKESMLLLLYTRKPISKAKDLTNVFECNLFAADLLAIRHPLRIDLVQTFPELGKDGNEIFRWPVDNLVRSLYTFEIHSIEHGLVKCKDTLGLGLEAEHIPYNVDGIVVKYAVPDLTGLDNAMNVDGFFPILISVDPDSPNDAEVLVRLETSDVIDPDYEGKLRDAAQQIAESNSWTIFHIRDVAHCPSEKTGTFFWPKTPFGRRAIPINPCYYESGPPRPVRRCLGNAFEGAYWETMDNILNPEPCMWLYISDNELKFWSHVSRDTITNFRKNLTEFLVKYREVGVTFTLSKLVEDKSYWLDIIDVILGNEKSVLEASEATSSSSENILRLISSFLAPGDLQPYEGENLRLLPLENVLLNSNRMGSNSEKQFEFEGDFKIYHLNLDGDIRAFYLEVKNESLFMTIHPDIELVGPIIGIVPREHRVPLHVGVYFKRDKGDTREMKCATWNYISSDKWFSPSPMCAQSTAKNGKTTIDICICSFISIGVLYLTRITEKKSGLHDGYLPIPKMELFITDDASDIFLNIHNDGLGEKVGSMDYVICTVNESPFTANLIGLDPTKALSLVKLNSLTTLLSNTSIIRVQYAGEGNLTCSDTLGLGVNSNQITVSKHMAAVALFKSEYKIDLSDFSSYYLKNLVHIFRMGILLQSIDRVSRELQLRFVRSHSITNRSFYEDVRELVNIIAIKNEWTVLRLRATLFCPYEEVEGLQWPVTALRYSTVPVHPCISLEGIPSPTRHCVGNYVEGSYWDPAPKKPGMCFNITQRASDIESIANREDKREAMEEISVKMPDEKPLEPYEVWTISKLLKDAAQEVSEKRTSLRNVTSLVTIVNSLLASGKDTLTKTDQATGSSQSVRESIDTLLASAVSDETSIVKMPHFSTLVAPLESGIRGFIQGNSSEEWMNESIEDVIKKSPKIAAYFQSIYIDQGRIVCTVFQENWLFDQPTGNEVAEGPVLGMTVFSKDGMEYKQPLSLVMFFPRGNGSSSGVTCQHWVPDLREWSSAGCQIMEDYVHEVPDMVACVCTHITFYQLIYPYSLSEEIAKKPYKINKGKKFVHSQGDATVDFEGTEQGEIIKTYDSHEKIMFVVSLVGSSISFCSLIIVFILAASKPKYREGDHRKVHLHITASQTLFIGCYLIISSYGRVPKSTFINMCVPLGIFLHYSILCTFAWSFIAALLLMLKFSPKTEKYRVRQSMARIQGRQIGTRHVLRASIFAWGLPILIVASVLGWGEYERRDMSALCFPVKEAFYATVLFPVSLICLANSVVFCCIYRVLSERGTEIMEQLRLALMYMVFLGLQWILGVAMNFCPKGAILILAYLFNTTATLQGLAMMVLFVSHDVIFKSKTYLINTEENQELERLNNKTHKIAKDN